MWNPQTPIKYQGNNVYQSSDGQSNCGHKHRLTLSSRSLNQTAECCTVSTTVVNAPGTGQFLPDCWWFMMTWWICLLSVCVLHIWSHCEWEWQISVYCKGVHHLYILSCHMTRLSERSGFSLTHRNPPSICLFCCMFCCAAHRCYHVLSEFIRSFIKCRRGFCLLPLPLTTCWAIKAFIMAPEEEHSLDWLKGNRE